MDLSSTLKVICYVLGGLALLISLSQPGLFLIVLVTMGYVHYDFTRHGSSDITFGTAFTGSIEYIQGLSLWISIPLFVIFLMYFILSSMSDEPRPLTGRDHSGVSFLGLVFLGIRILMLVCPFSISTTSASKFGFWRCFS